MHKQGKKAAFLKSKSDSKIFKYYCETDKKTVPMIKETMTRQAFQA